jgi:flagellar biosynthesis chaperone FliJ
MERDRLGDLERRLVEELDTQIDAISKQIAAGQEQLQRLRQKRAALVGETVKGVTPTGLSVIAANNTLQRLKRTGASKSDITKAEKTVADLRARLAQEKASRKGGTL